MQQLETFTYHIQDIQKAVAWLLNHGKHSPIWLANGAMGAGKTTLIRALLKHLGNDLDVSSPTYSLVNEYPIDTDLLPYKYIFHADLYRLSSEEEAYDIGLEDYFHNSDALFIIEWSERAQNLIPLNHFSFEIAREEQDENSRIIKILKQK